jgi:hypothetical protein
MTVLTVFDGTQRDDGIVRVIEGVLVIHSVEGLRVHAGGLVKLVLVPEVLVSEVLVPEVLVSDVRVPKAGGGDRGSGISV